jgi:hypothetical protein
MPNVNTDSSVCSKRCWLSELKSQLLVAAIDARRLLQQPLLDLGAVEGVQEELEPPLVGRRPLGEHARVPVGELRQLQ